MSGPGDFDHLSGTEVFFDKVSPPETWVLDEKITEQYQTVTQCEVDDGLGPPFAAIKFACYSAADPNKKGIMRIYIQTPINGTSARGPRARAQQAVTQRTYLELKALKSLADQKCKVVPELLGYNEEQQDDEGCVPGGYINHIVWARESLDYKVFWDRDLEYRNEVRPRFRKAYEELAMCGWRPGLTPLKKIIYDDLTKTIYISGYRDPDTLDSSEPFTDLNYASWGLVKRSRKPDWYLNSSEWTW